MSPTLVTLTLIGTEIKLFIRTNLAVFPSSGYKNKSKRARASEWEKTRSLRKRILCALTVLHALGQLPQLFQFFFFFLFLLPAVFLFFFSPTVVAASFAVRGCWNGRTGDCSGWGSLGFGHLLRFSSADLNARYPEQQLSHFSWPAPSASLSLRLLVSLSISD